METLTTSGSKGILSALEDSKRYILPTRLPTGWTLLDMPGYACKKPGSFRKTLNAKNIETACEAAMSAADPQSDMRGSAEYKRVLVRTLLKRAIHIAARRARGEHVEATHEYAGRI